MNATRASGIACAVLIAAGVLALGGCVQDRSVQLPPTELVEAVASGVKDDTADSECSQVYPETNFVSALDSTAGEVRQLAQEGPNGEPPDTQTLPKESGVFVAICISELPEDNPFNRTYWALWMTQGSTATGILAAWD